MHVMKQYNVSKDKLAAVYAAIVAAGAVEAPLVAATPAAGAVTADDSDIHHEPVIVILC